MDFEGREVFRGIKAIEWDLEAAEKAGYDHFMLKEIHEQPHVPEGGHRRQAGRAEG